MCRQLLGRLLAALIGNLVVIVSEVSEWLVETLEELLGCSFRLSLYIDQSINLAYLFLCFRLSQWVIVKSLLKY